ncbi:hypothetical protein PGT21_033067 [Puccinia graminis f. sp. tritici]|uniref:Uncharacterized protein n=1 Tax=Puccinia graminis f. sp. tritici TaxID=56615 RepID=A0A5B0M829_PUCGR|nr:hypothetical protein PGT21_033067 [Puccinia graminis f. sp. tritici]
MSLCRWKPSWLCIAPDRPFAKALVLSINTGSVPPFSTSPHCTSPSLSFLSFFIPLIIHNYHYNLFTNLHHFYRVVFRAVRLDPRKAEGFFLLLSSRKCCILHSTKSPPIAKTSKSFRVQSRSVPPFLGPRQTILPHPVFKPPSLQTSLAIRV